MDIQITDPLHVNVNVNDEEDNEVLTKNTFFEKWGFDLEELYKIALKFYKGERFFNY